MKRKLRTWVKVTAAVIWLCGLSAAASCANASIPATAGQTMPEPAGNRFLAEHSASGALAKTEQSHGAEEILFVPRLFREVISI